MSDETRAALHEAVAAHVAAEAEAAALTSKALVTGDPQDAEAATAAAAAAADRSAVEAAAHTHLDEVDPEYTSRIVGVEPSARVAAPDLKAAYDEALAASHANPDDYDLAVEARQVGDRYAAARMAARVLEGRPLGSTVGS